MAEISERNFANAESRSQIDFSNISILPWHVCLMMCQVAELCHWPRLPSKHKCVPDFSWQQLCLQNLWILAPLGWAVLSCGTGWTAWHGLSRLSTCEASVDQTSSSLGSGLNSFVFVSCEVSWWLNTECSNKTQSNHLKAKVFFFPFSFLLSLSFLSWQGFLKVWMPLAFQNLTPHLQITENNGPLQFKICCLQAYFPSWSGSL